MSDNNYNNPYGNNSNNPYRNSEGSTDNTPDKNNFTYDNRFYSAEHEHNPVNYIEIERARQNRRVGRGLKRVFALLIVAAILVGTIGTLSYFYQIVPGEGNTVFRLERVDRNSGSSTLQNTPGQVQGNKKTGAQRDVNLDGPELEIVEPPVATTNPVAKQTGSVLTVPEIAEKVMPSVVGIVSSVQSMYGTSSFSGTGIIMSTDGYIITNNHVIESAQDISVTLMDGSEHKAQLVGRDSRSDLAVIKIDVDNLVAAEFGDSDALKVGELAVAIGNPLGLDLMGTVTDGIISAINRDVVVEERTMTLIQTNAAINSGNSGGPLINKYGQVIGINTLKMQNYYTSVEGLGFAIPTNTAKPIIDELILYGYVKGRPTIGINVKTISEAQSRYYNVPQGVGVYYVHPDTDAYKQGLQVNDIITEAQGQKVTSAAEINKIKEEYVAGDLFTVKVYRSGKYYEISFELMDEAEIDMNESVFTLP
ncbi:MAG: S1C family serine protease [Eubacteriales bacterium]|jgi:serine protease Do